MSHRLQVQVLFHGAIVHLIGMLLGIPYAFAIVDKWGDEAERAWRVARVGESAAGVVLLVVGAAIGHVALTERALRLLVWSIIASGYGFTLGLPLAAVAGVRGLEPAGPLMNWTVFAVYLVGGGGGFVAAALMIGGFHAALRRL
jgi:hypothetical protein